MVMNEAQLVSFLEIKRRRMGAGRRRCRHKVSWGTYELGSAKLLEKAMG